MDDKKNTQNHLKPKLHEQQDFFVADILEASPKDDTQSMEHPLFALRAGDHRVRNYERNGCTVTVKPGHDGCATIYDKDLWIYCISQLVEAKNRGREISRTVRFTAYDFLVTTNRDTSGRAYLRSEEHTSELQSRFDLVCRLLLEKKNKKQLNVNLECHLVYTKYLAELLL